MQEQSQTRSVKALATFDTGYACYRRGTDSKNEESNIFCCAMGRSGGVVLESVHLSFTTPLVQL